jgi:hypothetical protein
MQILGKQHTSRTDKLQVEVFCSLFEKGDNFARNQFAKRVMGK